MGMFDFLKRKASANAKIEVFANTKELEEKYPDLSKMPETVQVQGGLAQKDKYTHDEKYKIRTTYTREEMIEIIGRMRAIESNIPQDWNQFQKAKYIYEELARNIEYNHNQDEYKSQKPSSLKGLIEGKAICAGFALIYKDMMDRQGIECNYVRGIADSRDNSKHEQHAWNMLTISGTIFPVDLTWDSTNLQDCLKKGKEENLIYFGTDENFFVRHHQDAKDEKELKEYTVLYKDFVESIDTDPKSLEKMKALQYAIDKTYSKYSRLISPEKGRNQIKGAIRKFIDTQNPESFTGEYGARDKIIEQFASKKDMAKTVEKMYRRLNKNPERKAPFKIDKSMGEMIDEIVEHCINVREQSNQQVKDGRDVAQESLSKKEHENEYEI